MPIRVEIELEDGSFTSRMIHAGETVNQFRNNVGGTIRSVERLNDVNVSFLGTIRDVSIALGMARIAFDGVRNIMGGWVGDIVKVNAEMEKLQFLLKGMSKAVDPVKDAANSVKFLRDAAKEAPFTLGALTDTFVKMKSTGLDPLSGGFKSLLDSIAAFGGSDEQLKRATVAITQMSGKGVIQMEELRQQLGEAVPRAVELLARSMGVSTGQLINIIGSGTLDAKSSLAALAVEFELTFGGAAQAQMKTFNGMISQSTTLMQNLALKMGEGFFEVIKTKLKEINTMLDGDVMSTLATQAGAVLGSVVNHISSAISWVIQFRSELYTLGVAIGSAFAVSTLIKFGSAMTGAFGNIRTEYAKAAIDLAQMRSGFAGLGGTVAGVRSVSDATAAIGLAAGASARILPALGSALMFVGSAALPVVGIIAALAFQFGWLADKQKDAFESMIEYGAQSEKQLANAEKFLERRKALSHVDEEQLKHAGNSMNLTPEHREFAEGQRQKSRQEIDAMQEQISKAREKFQQREIASAVRSQVEELDERLLATRTAFDKEQNEREKAYGEKLKTIQKEHGDNKALTLVHQTEGRAARLAMYDQEIEEIQWQIDRQNTLRSLGDKTALGMDAQFQKEMLDRQVRSREAANRLRAMPLGPIKIDKVDDIDKMIEKAKAKTEDMKSSVAGLRAELGGASGEYAKMAFMINEARAKGNYAGPLSNADIKAATDELLRQQEIFDEYTAKLSKQRQIDAELNRILLKSQQAITTIANASKNDLDKLFVAVREGSMSGLTPIQQINVKFGEMATAAKTAADAMKEAFGAVLPAVDGLNSRLSLASNGMRSFNASRGSRDGSVDERIIASESGNNRFAKNPNSTATGLGQFIESTWLQFLKEMRPDINRGIAMGSRKDGTYWENTDRTKALAMRTDENLSKAAVEWYRKQNGRQLNDAGLDATDANMKLAHFLGGGGAISALSQSDDTLVRSIPQLEDAIKANSDVFKKISTVGDLKAWAGASMGKPYKSVYDNDSRVPIPAGLTPNEQRASEEARLRIQKENAARVIEGMDDWSKEIAAKIREAREDGGGKLSNYAAGRRKIEEGSGPFGNSNRNADDPIYAKRLADLKELDAAEETSSDRRKARTAIESAIAKQGIQDVTLAQRKADMEQRLDEEKKFKFSSSYYAMLREFENEKLAATTAVNTGVWNQTQADEFLARAKAAVAMQRTLELQSADMAAQEKIKIVERGLMGEGQARDAALNEEIRQIRLRVNEYAVGSQERVDAEVRAAREIAAKQAQAFSNAPLGKMLQNYRDFSSNLEKSAVGWIDGFSDSLAKMVVTGKADFKSLADSIITDIVRIGIRSAMSNLFGGILGGAMGGGGFSLGGPSGPAMLSQHHSGGIAGQNASMRMIDMSVFSGAPRFHTGSRGMTLAGDEIPIIAKKGEQIDWPENLAKQYGGGGATIAPTIQVSVQGSPGASQADHERMGATIAKAVNDSVKSMMAAELRTQMRPNGLLSGKRR